MKPRARKKVKAYRYGIAAEKAAALYLRCKGYRILAERYRSPMGEIDLIAARGKMLVAVEVKARATLAACEETVPPAKQQRIARAMQGFTGLAFAPEHTIRFDVIWIAPWRWPLHIKDAWRL